MPNDSNSIQRLLDAAANRAGEAARVVEDYVRFVLDDKHLTEHCKQLRHDLADALSGPDGTMLCASRNTLSDVGCQVTTDAEMQRADARHVCIASFKRLEQSLRSLEEFSKVSDGGAAARFEQIRYRTYTLEKAVSVTDESRQVLAGVRLCVLVDGRDTLANFKKLVTSLVDAGVDMIQLRDKTLGDREFLARARAARTLTSDSDTLLVINDRADIAALIKAAGLHIGQDDLSVQDVRDIVGAEMLIGVSTHSVEDARQAVLDGASYIGIGPVFPSATKDFDEFKGTETIAAVAAEISLPAFAIGGIDQENIERVLSAGIARIAVSHAVMGHEDPASAARHLAETLRDSAIASSS